MSSPHALAIVSLVPSLTVDDLGKSIAFYEALGFSVAERWEENGALTSVMIQAGPQQIGLNQDDWQKGRDRTKGTGIRLHVETSQDVDEIAARVKDAGFVLDKEPYDTPWTTRQFELTDPSGFTLSISTVWSR